MVMERATRETISRLTVELKDNERGDHAQTLNYVLLSHEYLVPSVNWLLLSEARAMSTNPEMWTIDWKKSVIMIPRERVIFVEMYPFYEELTEKQINRLLST